MSYGRRSIKNIETCSKSLQRVAHRAMLLAESLGFDLTVTEGHRGEEEQNEAFKKKLSKLKFPRSRHNRKPSQAIHILPYPILWPTEKQKEKTRAKCLGRFYIVATIVRLAAKYERVKIRWGGDWNGDGKIMDNDFDDLGHFETVSRNESQQDKDLKQNRALKRKRVKGIGSM